MKTVSHTRCNNQANKQNYFWNWHGFEAEYQSSKFMRILQRSGMKATPLNKRQGFKVLPPCLCSYQNPNLCIQMILDMGVVSRWAGLSYTKSDHHPMLLTEKHPTRHDNTTPHANATRIFSNVWYCTSDDFYHLWNCTRKSELSKFMCLSTSLKIFLFSCWSLFKLY